MIDPQGQAVSWIRSKESSNLPAFGTAALNDPKLRDKLEFTMGDGKALIILGEFSPSYRGTTIGRAFLATHIVESINLNNK